MPDQNELLMLHGQLLAGDVRAGSKIVEKTIAPLVAIVAQDVQGLHDLQDVEQACFDALFAYLAAPGKYNREQAGLMTFLAAIAKGKAQTARRSQQRAVRRDAKYAESDADAKASVVADDDEASALARIDWTRCGGELVKDPGDAEILALMKIGEHSDVTVAAAIGLAGDSLGLAEAARRMERVRGRVRRLAKKMKI